MPVRTLRLAVEDVRQKEGYEPVAVSLALLSQVKDDKLDILCGLNRQYFVLKY